MEQRKTLIIVGPTGSGKTSLSEELIASCLSGEIINTDMGQLYEPLSVGTAKPPWKDYPFRSHLFDYINKPEHFDAHSFVQTTLELVDDIHQRGNVPMIVGGTMFYVKSLFFELPFSPQKKGLSFSFESPRAAWNYLEEIDPCRAAALHPNDTYRVNRALELWQQTGIPPSQLKPVFSPKVDPIFVYIQPERKLLKERIAQRTQQMLFEQGWIEEAAALLETPWEHFIIQKGLIGYDILFDWLRSGKRDALHTIEQKIVSETWSYAKRQMAFWRRFVEQLHNESVDYPIITLAASTNNDHARIAQIILKK